MAQDENPITAMSLAIQASPKGHKLLGEDLGALGEIAKTGMHDDGVEMKDVHHALVNLLAVATFNNMHDGGEIIVLDGDEKLLVRITSKRHTFELPPMDPEQMN